LFSQNNELKII